MNSLRLRISRSGRPLVGWAVAVGGDAAGTTNGRGYVDLQLTPGKHLGEVRRDDERLAFKFVCAAGLRELQVELEIDEPTLDDADLMRKLPSDRYEPLRVVGEGAMGSVLKCRDKVLGRIVAIKMLHDDVDDDAEREAFLAEARALAAVEHPNLVPVYDVGVTDERAWLVTAFIDGPNLEQLLLDEEVIPLEAVASAGAQLARGLAELHAAGLVHQDVKPGNGLVDRRGRVYLADFGLVQHLAETHVERDQVSGTPAYMSPELVQGLPVGPANDVYALGASLFHVATGRLPFLGSSMDQLRAHVQETPPPLIEYRKDAPPEFAALVASMLTKEPAERPTAKEVARRLEALARQLAHGAAAPFLPRLEEVQDTMALVPAKTIAGLSTTLAGEFGAAAPGPTRLQDAVTPPPKRRPVVPIVAAVALVGLAILGALWMPSPPDAPPEPTPEAVAEPEPPAAEPAELEAVGTPDEAPAPEPSAVAAWTTPTPRPAPRATPTPRRAPAAAATPKPVAEPVPEPTPAAVAVAEPAVESAPEPDVEPAADEPAPEPAGEPVAGPASEPEPEPAVAEPAEAEAPEPPPAEEPAEEPADEPTEPEEPAPPPPISF